MRRTQTPKENRMPPWMTNMAQFNQMFPGLDPQYILGLMQARAYGDRYNTPTGLDFGTLMGMQQQQQQPKSLEEFLAQFMSPDEIQQKLGGR